ncbi:MAG: sigma-70 family RNA polymerase sigma factor [Ignavibacteria bacterium]|nr:sigma-70 family RNA polymerase sigma factor [Ignavibacteria bacterium]MBT8381600.1 sigma-70 family RNA polymerase sigma factor [Ignavibacteria bacterium]MBT8391991.1 sigma-70 family RNA polymerase sigma factor [Ignavibacteria bacterium]NNJ53149.1 sigma-70 family RNA polymerase sigma factor [Ignavibacteriaceae bacterium]NNL21052.1 sigma-70 family RNA polymerase sigma factor [Ignavibacteriaceae bacterium]
MEVESRYIRSLLQSAQSGNNAALEQLFEMNLNRVYTISHRLTGNKQDAELLASKTLVEAWKQIHKIRTDVPFNLWLDSLNINQALKHLREIKEEKKKRRLFNKNKIEEKEPDSKISQLDAEICKLPKEERSVFVLSKIENYSAEELFGMTALSPNQIKDKIKSAEDFLLKADFIQTSEMLKKKITELPQKFKADKKILKDAFTEIYELKLIDRVEEEEEEIVDEYTEVVDVKKEPIKSKPKDLKVKREIGIEVPSFSPEFKKKLGWTILIIAIAVAGYIVITSGLKGWEASLQGGTAKLGRNQLTGSSTFAANEILKTEENSVAEVTIPSVGKITVEEQTEFKRLDQKNSAELIKGKIKVDCSGAEEFFNLQIPESIISGYYLGSIYSVELNADKSGQVFVDNGWITITNNDKEIIAATNHYVDFNATFGLSVPYNKNAATDFADAVKEFLYTKSELYVERIVSLAEKRDALTLWNLFNIVSPSKRLLVYSTLNSLIPHPPSVTNDDVLNLDKLKLQIWLEEIEWNF